MDRKKITAYLIDCKSADIMAFADLADQGIAVVGPDGKKYRFSVDQLEKTEVLMNDKCMQMTLAEVVASSEAPGAASGTRKEPASPASKRPAKPGTRKPAAKPKRKPAKKPGSAPKTA